MIFSSFTPSTVASLSLQSGIVAINSFTNVWKNNVWGDVLDNSTIKKMRKIAHRCKVLQNKNPEVIVYIYLEIFTCNYNNGNSQMLFIAFLLAIFLFFTIFIFLHFIFEIKCKNIIKFFFIFLSFVVYFLFSFLIVVKLLWSWMGREVWVLRVAWWWLWVVLMRYTWDVLTKESCSQFSVAFTIYLCRCLVEKFFNFFCLFLFSNQTSIVCFKTYFAHLT